MHQVSVPDQYVALLGGERHLGNAALGGALLQRTEVALDLLARRTFAGHSRRLVRTLVVILINKVLEPMAAGIVEQLAGADRDILQRGPGGGELARNSVGDIGGVLMSLLRRATQEAQRLRGEGLGI